MSLEAVRQLDLGSLDPETKQPVKFRLPRAEDAHRLYSRLREEDKDSALNRAMVQSMLDGAPPYNDKLLKSTNQGFKSNVNYGEGRHLLNNALSAYVDMLHSVEHLVRVKTLFGETDEERAEYSEILSEEISAMIRRSPQYTYNFLENCTNFIAHGVSIAYFRDDKDWRWSVSKFGDFLIPRQTRATEDDIEVAMCMRTYNIGELWSFIRDEGKAKSVGWDVGATKAYILDLIKQGCDEAASTDDWEKWQEQVKNNDLYLVHAAARAKVVHAWVKEMDGSVTHCLFREDEEPDTFLLRKANKFESMSQAFVFFTFGVGTNGKYHGIRGLGNAILPLVQLSNRLRNQAADGAFMGSSLLAQPQSAEDAEDLSITFWGPAAVISPTLKVLNQQLAPNYNQFISPVLNDLAMQLQHQTGQFSPQNVFSDQRERTRFEVAAQLEQVSALNVTSQNLFHEPHERLTVEQVRRIVKNKFSSGEPGGAEVVELLQRLARRGVPEEALRKIDIRSVKATRAVGAGSAASRHVILSELVEMMSAFDSTGRHNALRDKIAAKVGYDQVDRYVPRKEGVRPTIDDKLAELENAAMSDGNDISVQENENHATHLKMHIEGNGGLLEYLAAEAENPDALMEVLGPVVMIHDHATQHLAAIQGDPSVAGLVAQYSRTLQQAGEIIENGRKKAEAQAREQAAEGEQADGFDPALAAKLQKNQLELQMMREKHELKLQLQLAEAQQEMRLAQQKAASDNLAKLLR